MTQRCEILAELLLDERAPERSGLRLIEWAAVCRASGIVIPHRPRLSDLVKAALCREASSRKLRCFLELPPKGVDQRVVQEEGAGRPIIIGVNRGERLHAWLAARRELGSTIGYTDLLPRLQQPLNAALAGTPVVMKGLTLNRSLGGQAHQAGLHPSEFAQLVAWIVESQAIVNAALERARAGGTAASEPLDSSAPLAHVESVVAARALKKHSLLKAEDLKRAMSLTGLTAALAPRVDGVRLLFDREMDEPVTFGVIEPLAGRSRGTPCDVSVVIRTKNEADWLRRSLSAIWHQHQPPREIIVVNNDSTDETAAIAEASGCRVLTIRDDEFSFGRALNRGIASARSAWVVSLSAHCIPLHDRWLDAWMRETRDPFTAAMYGRQEPLPDTSDFDKRDLWTTFGEERRLQQGQDYFFHNANSMIRREVWERIPFDETLSGVEDRDWAKKVLADGYQIVYTPLASVHHYHGIHQGRNEARAKRVVKVIELIQQREPVESPAP